MPRTLMMSIAAVERDTGLSKDTLRVWEKRYGFPNPSRDKQGERIYSMDQIERLRLLKRLLDVGHRPGRVVSLPLQTLSTLAQHSADALGLNTLRQDTGASDSASPIPAIDILEHDHLGAWVSPCLAHVAAHDDLALRHHLAQAVGTLGLAHFITEVAAPLLQAVGEGWLRGHFQVPQEHWVSHRVQQTLHSAIHAMPLPLGNQPPRVLLTTLPGEPHGLGLLMVEGWLSLLQAHPINLGPQTPLWDLVHAAAHHQADVIGLSFTASAPASLIQEALIELRAKLPPHVAVWAGGGHPLLQRRPAPGVQIMQDMPAISTAVQNWRRAHAGNVSCKPS